MKPLFKFSGLLMFLLLIFSAPAAAAYYDQNGNKVEKDQYEKVIQMRAATVNKINTEGYGEDKTTLEDPVRLRKKRVEQWKSLQKKDRGR